ncbi:MAG TPA: adenylate/guanylate cyclase domain-containing protein [Usitatibacter sp.]|nr:adenylate/guanylate cyclase domain-containing protein [Usitatibacter sp.]
MTPRSRQALLAAVVVALLVALPLCVWRDLRHISRVALERQARDVNAIVTSIRGYYASNVVARVLASPDHTRVVNNYESVPGAIPIPATLSLELGHIIGEKQGAVAYRFISDLPFTNRAPHPMDEFERSALAGLRAGAPGTPVDVSSAGLTTRVRVISPILMGATCIGCHNTHPESPKRDWKVGDVRGIQEVSVMQPIATNLFSFKYTLAWLLLAATAGFAFITFQRRQAALIGRINRELAGKNDFLASISSKLSRYLAPQIYASIFSGQKDVSIRADRKKLTIFFSDIKDFTALTESMQPEEITALLNEYLTEMSAIAIRHGGTIDKFIGDAVMVFFGDPETKGIAEDARAALRMAFEMQERLAELNIHWRAAGLEQPLRVRMGINTGYCNVGNFGSQDRMDYTILGAEVNLAARLQSIAEPGRIVVSYETYALTLDVAVGHALPAIAMKGIAREVVPYAIDGRIGPGGTTLRVIAESSAGLDLYLDPGRVDPASVARLRSALEAASAELAKIDPGRVG